jgi:hypothetical protein
MWTKIHHLEPELLDDPDAFREWWQSKSRPVDVLIELVYPGKQPGICICIKFADTGGFRVADLTCPVHGVDGTEPGDGMWE